MRDSDYGIVSADTIADVLTHLDNASPGWERAQPMIFYETLFKRHPDVLRLR